MDKKERSSNPFDYRLIDLVNERIYWSQRLQLLKGCLLYYMIKWLNFVFFVREIFMNWIWNDGQTDEGEYETCEEHLFHFLDQTIIVLMKIV